MSALGKKILLAKTGLDGHWRGVSLVEKRLQEAGFLVVMIGMATPDEIVSAAVEQDVDLVGLNVGGHIEVVHKTVDQLNERMVGVPVFAGGAIAPWAKKELEDRHIEVYPPGSSLEDIVDAAFRLCRINVKASTLKIEAQINPKYSADGAKP